MKYFELLPKITYGDIYSIRNLNKKYYFLNDINPEYLSTYDISDGESLESICVDQYKDPSLWWLIAILNDIEDIIFDLPLTEEILQTIARDLATTDSVLDDTLYLEKYDLLVDENDTKRTIRIFKPEFIQKVLSEISKQVSEL